MKWRKSKDNNLEAFFALLKSGLWEYDCNLALLPVDYHKVYRLASEQTVVGLVAAGIEHVVGSRPLQKDVISFMTAVLLLEQRNMTMNSFICKMMKELRKVGITAVLVKGQGIAQCYERPHWRACGDVDLLLDDDNFKKAQELFLPIASSSEPLLEEEKHQEFVIENWVVEIHGNMPCHFSRRTDRVLESFLFDMFKNKKFRFWKNGDVMVPLLCAEYDVLFVFTHYLKHFFRGGIGLRQICDWCRLLWVYHSEIKVDLLEEKIHKMGLMSEWRTFAALAVDTLGMPIEGMPLYSSSKKWSRKAKMVLAIILETGNFGHKKKLDYYGKYPYLICKIISLNWRLRDNIRYFNIFPIDSLRVFSWLICHGLHDFVRGR